MTSVSEQAQPVQRPARRHVLEELNRMLDGVLNSRQFSPEQVQQFYDEGQQAQRRRIEGGHSNERGHSNINLRDVVVRRVERPGVVSATPESQQAARELSGILDSGQLDFDKWARRR